MRQGNESGNVYRLSEKAAGSCTGSFEAVGEILTGEQFDSDKFVKFSKFKTVDDFKKHLKLQSQRLLWKVFFAQAVSKI